LKLIAFSGLKDEKHWVHIEIFEGSHGGRLGKDGMDAVDTRSTPTPTITRSRTSRPTCPCAHFCERREDVAGAGKWRGGWARARVHLPELGRPPWSKAKGWPWAFLGGGEGMPAKLDLPANCTTHAQPSKVPH
jgi:N-methylhydantoinase B